MAKFYLLNAIALAGTNYRPGDLLDDTLDATANVRAAGGVLWPATDPVVAAAAALALKRRRSGASDDAIGLLMSTAGLASTAGAAAASPFGYDSGTDTATVALTAGTAASFAPTATTIGVAAGGSVFLTANVLDFIAGAAGPVLGQVQATVGAGKTFTWRPQAGHTPGTDLSGNARVDLGQKNAATTSPKFGVDVDGASILDIWVNAGTNEIDLQGGGKFVFFGNGEIDAGAQLLLAGTPLLLDSGGTLKLQTSFGGITLFEGDATGGGRIGVYGVPPVARPNVTGSKVGGAALVSLLAALTAEGWITDGTSA